MLAYVFWHWRHSDVDAAVYARLLFDFHRTLNAHPPTGFLSSASFRGGSAAWIPADEGYEDWYLTAGSQALDPLNACAVEGPCRAPHEAAARAAKGGTAGLYRLRAGRGDVAAAGWSAWFAKPTGMAYPALLELLRPLSSKPGVGLWGRQMTLGPTPEFCLMSGSALELPEPVDGLARPLERVWPH